MAESTLTVGLYWHSFESSNLGVSALTDANMTIISDAAAGRAVRFVIFGPKGQGDFDPPPELRYARHIAVSSVWRAKHVFDNIRKCDLVFDIGAGDSFADIYGWKRLIKIAGLKILSKIAGRPPILSPQTIGPFSSGPTRMIGKLAIRACKTVFARDRLSFDRAMMLIGDSKNTRLENASDVAFELNRLSSWPHTFPDLDKSRKQVGINVSGLLYSGGYNRDNQFGLSLDYKDLLHKILEALSLRADTQVWLIPHVFHIDRVTLECDRAVSIEIQESFPNISIAPVFKNAREAKTFIGAMDLVLAARMHAAIAAVSSGVACVPMSYSVKFQGLFESLGYSHTVDLKASTETQALAQIVQSLDSTEVMAAQAELATRSALEALKPYRAYVSSEIARVTQAQ